MASFDGCSRPSRLQTEHLDHVRLASEESKPEDITKSTGCAARLRSGATERCVEVGGRSRSAGARFGRSTPACAERERSPRCGEPWPPFDGRQGTQRATPAWASCLGYSTASSGQTSRGRALAAKRTRPGEERPYSAASASSTPASFIARNSRTPSRRSEREDHPRASRPPPLALALGLLKPLACPLRPSLPRAGSLLRARPQRWSRSLGRRERGT